MLQKPPTVAEDPYKSDKWDEITSGQSLSESDVPSLVLLCQWHAVVQRCIDDMDEAGGQVAYQNQMGDLKALPQLATMKQASAEIRALNKQLGINEKKKGSEKKSSNATILTMVVGDRKKKAAGG